MKTIEIYEFSRSICIAKYWTTVTVTFTYGRLPRVNGPLFLIFCQYLATILPTAFDPAGILMKMCPSACHEGINEEEW